MQCQATATPQSTPTNSVSHDHNTDPAPAMPNKTDLIGITVVMSAPDTTRYTAVPAVPGSRFHVTADLPTENWRGWRTVCQRESLSQHPTRAGLTPSNNVPTITTYAINQPCHQHRETNEHPTFYTGGVSAAIRQRHSDQRQPACHFSIGGAVAEHCSGVP